MCHYPHETQKTIEAEERKFNREYEEEQERLREEETEREIKEMEDDMSRPKDTVILCESCGKKFGPWEKVILQSRTDDFKPIADRLKISDEFMIKEAQCRIIETIIGLENECALKPTTITVYKDVLCAWRCKIGMEVRT